MKLHLKLVLVTLLAATFGLDVSQAANLTPRQFRKFVGSYTGPVSGIAGNNARGSAQVAFNAMVRVTARRNEFLRPLISSLHVEPTHRILWRVPTGTPRRAKLVGVYTGTYGGGAGSVSGTRTLIITDRGPGLGFRYSMRFSDSLRENGTSGQNLSGVLRRKR